MASVAAHRKTNVTCVLEGLYDAGNVGAVGRSAEAFGITDIAIVSLHGVWRLVVYAARSQRRAHDLAAFSHPKSLLQQPLQRLLRTSHYVPAFRIDMLVRCNPAQLEHRLARAHYRIGDRWKQKHAGRTAQGADKWLGFSKHTSTEACYRALREQGCRIYVASCDPAGGPAVPPYAATRGVSGDGRSGVDESTASEEGPAIASSPPAPAPAPAARPATPLSEVDWHASPRLAVVFGNEYMGLSSAAVELVRASERFAPL